MKKRCDLKKKYDHYEKKLQKLKRERQTKLLKDPKFTESNKDNERIKRVCVLFSLIPISSLCRMSRS